MQNAMYKILVVDDEEDLCEILRFNLETEGYLVDTVHSAEEALSLALEDYDLILLDVMMGKISGFSMAQMLKKSEQTKNVPFIFLTARDTENDTITGFNLGADDYIAKPFSIREVMLRVKAVLKRTQKQAIEKEDKGETLFFEGLEMNLERKTVRLDGEETGFTKTEFELLLLLFKSRGRVFSRQELIDKAWPKDVLVSDRTVDVYITRVRKKIGRFAKCIVTRQGFGYYFDA